MQCRACQHPLSDVILDLGMQPPANAYCVPNSTHIPPAWPLQLRWCANCTLLQTDETPPADVIFDADYVYFSSYARSWVDHARRFVAEAIEELHLNAQSLVVEVASNDGYLLQHVQAAGVPCYGIEPTHSTAHAARNKGITTHTCFLTHTTAQQLRATHKAADLLVANNVLAHVPDINDFVAGLAHLLAPQGTLCIEFPHVQAMLQDTQFDTVYHEHYSYFSLLSAQFILKKHGLRVYKVQHLTTHGGSLRLWVCHEDASMLPDTSVARQISAEYDMNLHHLQAYQSFQTQTQQCIAQLQQFVAQNHDKRIAAYGAAAKGVTIVNACGFTNQQIIAVADSNPYKQGKIWPHSNIPIIAPAQLAALQPAILLLFARNLFDEICADITYPCTVVTAIPRLNSTALSR